MKTIRWGDDDKISDELQGAEIDVTVSDESFDYEYGSQVGVHRQYGYHVDGDDVIFRVASGEDEWEPEPEYNFKRTIGGCDGAHSGRCRKYCAEHEVEVTWRMVSFSEPDQNGYRLLTYGLRSV